MPDNTFEYAVVRVVPRVERQEFVNVGVVLSYPAHNFLRAAIEPDWDRIAVFAPTLDRAVIEAHLDAIRRVCAGDGPIGALPQRARFHWLVAPRSTSVQLSPVHSGFCDSPDETLKRLTQQLVHPIPERGETP